MRFLIISDLHANWAALEAVLAEAEGKYDQIICCGDLVGYNPDPAQVLEWTQQACAHVIRGNHDKAVGGADNLEWFNDVARAAAEWTRAVLTSAQLQYLRELPKGPVAVDGFEIWHGSPRDEDEYVTNGEEAIPSFPYLQSPVGFFGHTHLQGGFFSKHRRIGAISPVRKKEKEAVLGLEPDVMYMVNPGSIGQPRDGDPRAAYAVFDSEQRVVYLRRVTYPIRKTAEAIIEVGLPGILAQRLFAGL